MEVTQVQEFLKIFLENIFEKVEPTLLLKFIFLPAADKNKSDLQFEQTLRIYQKNY